jgi:hypothetical protein
MQLPCAWFEQIVATLDGAEEASLAAPMSAPAGAVGEAPEQRRREPRVGVRSRITLIPLTHGAGLGATPIRVPVRDLSAGGIGFLHSAKVDLDAQFVALLPHGRDSVAVLCQVAFYQPLGERSFAVGAKFVRVLRQPALESGRAVLTSAGQVDAPSRRIA